MEKHWVVGDVTREHTDQLPEIEIAFTIRRGSTPALNKSSLRDGKATRRIAVPLTEAQVIALKKTEGEIHNMGTGHASLFIDQTARRLTWYEFYPFCKLSIVPRKTRIGIALHYEIAKMLAEHFPGHTIKHYNWVSEQREAQLKKQGIDWQKEYPIEEYAAILKRAIEKGESK
ncbi:MAG: hypothetical protein V1722_04845 [Candidatus Micrarchaeota archaeon]